MDRHQLKQRPFSQLSWPLQSVPIVQAGDATIRSAELLALNTVNTGLPCCKVLTLIRLTALMRLRDDSRSPCHVSVIAQAPLLVFSLRFCACETHIATNLCAIDPSFSRRASIVGLPGAPIENIIDGLFLRCLSRRPQNLCLINSVRH